MTNNAAMLLLNPGHKSRHIFKRNQRNIERIAETHESRTLHAGVDVQHSGEKRRLIRHHPNRPPGHASKPNHNVPRKVLLHLEEISIVHHARDHIDHVVRLIALRRNNRVQRNIGACRIVLRSLSRRVIEIV